MSLPVPNLDDRSWQQIVDEAIRLIPRYNPEWTNHNPSDPGVTLLELYAWMTEMVIYRLNKVPEKNFLTFLDLIGVRLMPPEPARTTLEFVAVDKAQGELFVKKGTQVATVQAGGAQPVVFETERDLQLVQVKLLKAASSHKGKFQDHTEPLAAGADQAKEALFMGIKEVERFLYLGDERFSAFNEEAAIDVLIDPMPGVEMPSFPAITEWQYYDGKRWRDMAINRAESGPRHLAFGSQPGIEATEVNGLETFWIRGKLVESTVDPKIIQLDGVEIRVEILGDGITPDSCFVNIGQNIYLPVELGKVFYPFGEEPKYDSAIYLCTKELATATESRVRVEVTLVDPSIVPAPEPSMDLQLVWEYWNGRKWLDLGKTSAMGVSGAQGQYAFLDNTQALGKNGSVSFDRPADMAEVEVSGTKSYWIRARINQGNYGTPGSYELSGENWIFKEDRPLRPPALKNMVFKYTREPKPIAHALSWNDFIFRDHTDDNLQPYVYFQPFLPDPDENPAVYFGFDKAFPQRGCRIYVRLDDAIDPMSKEGEGGVGPRLVWEYWDGKRWAELLPDDRTVGLTRSGYLEFDGPKDMATTSKFELEAFWFRARMEAGAYDRAPVLKAVLMNAVDAVNGITLYETVGSSDGTQDQMFVLANQPILGGAKVYVREADGVPANERAELLKEEGDDAIAAPGEGGTWVRWHSVDHFFESTPASRHYVIDPIKGEVHFGDGKNGKVPPMARDNVKVEYQIGGGTGGNVGARSLNILKQSVAFVQGVTNPFPSLGGTNAETVDEAKRRGTFAIKNRDRAVTAEDYEQLAMAASRRVSRARCVQASDGSVRVILVPKAETEGDARSIPSRDLIDRVGKYIDRRRLITAAVEVGKPRYVDVSLELAVSMKPGATSERVKSDVRDKLKKLMHPTLGGSKGDGWPFGRAVGKADIYPGVEGVDGVDRVLELSIVDEARHVRVETLKLAEDELPNLVGVEIIDRG